METPRESAFARLVHRLERVTRTDLDYLLSGGFWLTVNQVGIGLIALGLSVAFAHYLPKDAYGTYRFLLSMFWTLTAFSLSGIPTALIRAVAKGDRGAFAESFRLSLFGGVPMFLISAGISVYYYANGNFLLATGSLIIALLGPLMQAAYLFGAYFEGARDFRKNAFFGIALNAIPALAMLAALRITDDPLMFLGLNLGLSVVTGLVIIALFIPREATAPRAASKEFTLLSGHFSVMNILFTISQQADKLIVFHFLGAVPLAIYSFASSIPEQIKGVIGNIEILAFPKFATRPIKEIILSLGRRLGGLTLLIALGVGVYILLAPYLFSLLFPAYMDAVWYSQLYALSLIPTGAVVPISALQAHAAKRELYVYNVLSPLVQIGALLFGVMYYGIIGAIVARIVGRIFSLALALALINVHQGRLARQAV